MRPAPTLIVSLLLAACGQTLDRVAVVEPRRGVPVEPVVVPVEAPLPVPAERVLRPRPRPEPPPPPTAGRRIDGPSLPRMEPVRGRIAVVIGIDRYPDAPDLTAAAADARTVDRALRRVGFGRIRLLLDGEATRAAILSAVSWLGSSSSKREPGVLFYAGHVRRLDGDPDGDGEDRDEAMLAADGRVVYDGEIARALAPARGPLWLAYAACFAGGFSDAAGPGRISTYAAAEDRLAYESPELGRSFMVEHMVDRAMLGAGLHGVEEMHRFASNDMEGRYRRFRPLQDDRVSGSLLLGDRPPAAEPEGGPDLGCVPGLTC